MELSGLLNKALEGLSRLYENNKMFSENDTVNKAMENYQKSNDPVAAFISERCILDKDSGIDRTALSVAYYKYCLGEGFGSISRIGFYKKIRSLKNVSDVKTAICNMFSCIKLK